MSAWMERDLSQIWLGRQLMVSISMSKLKRWWQIENVSRVLPSRHPQSSSKFASSFSSTFIWFTIKCTFIDWRDSCALIFIRNVRKSESFIFTIRHSSDESTSSTRWLRHWNIKWKRTVGSGKIISFRWEKKCEDFSSFYRIIMSAIL